MSCKFSRVIHFAESQFHISAWQLSKGLGLGVVNIKVGSDCFVDLALYFQCHSLTKTLNNVTIDDLYPNA